jgi:phytoene desaturase
MKSNRKHIVIIGAGPGGLCAGMLLSHRGFRVSLFDKNADVGGRNRPLRLGEFRFDTGPTFLLMKGVLDEMFALCATRSEDYLQFRKLDPMYRLLFTDRELTVYSDREQMRAELARVFPTGVAGYERFMPAERERFLRLYPCMQRDYSHWSRFLSWDLLRALPKLALPHSVFTNLARYFTDEKLRVSFSFQSKYLGMAPWDCPALFTMLAYIEHEYGIYHVMGGLNRISSAMAKVIEERGGVIHTDTAVQSLLLDRRKVTGIRLATGEEIPADEVIVNADFAYAASNLIPPGRLRKYSAERLERKQYSCSTFMLYLGLRKRYDIPHHNVVFAQDYRSNVDNIMRRKILSADFSFYVHNASVTDPGLAPAGKSALYILVPVPNNFSDINWNEQRRAELREQTLTALGTRLGLHDIREHIETEASMTPRSWEEHEHVYRGATFSLTHKFSQLLYWRPHNRFEELDRCYLVGGGTHPGSGLPTIYESARITAKLICRKHGVPFGTHKSGAWI